MLRMPVFTVADRDVSALRRRGTSDQRGARHKAQDATFKNVPKYFPCILTPPAGSLVPGHHLFRARIMDRTIFMRFELHASPINHDYIIDIWQYDIVNPVEVCACGATNTLNRISQSNPYITLRSMSITQKAHASWLARKGGTRGV